MITNKNNKTFRRGLSPRGEEENKERTNISTGAEGEGEETEIDK